jgi:hypothetical protein
LEISKASSRICIKFSLDKAGRCCHVDSSSGGGGDDDHHLAWTIDGSVRPHDRAEYAEQSVDRFLSSWFILYPVRLVFRLFSKLSSRRREISQYILCGLAFVGGVWRDMTTRFDVVKSSNNMFYNSSWKN